MTGDSGDSGCDTRLRHPGRAKESLCGCAAAFGGMSSPALEAGEVDLERVEAAFGEAVDASGLRDALRGIVAEVLQTRPPPESVFEYVAARLRQLAEEKAESQ